MLYFNDFLNGYTENYGEDIQGKYSLTGEHSCVKGLSITAVIKDVFKKILPKKNDGEVETSLIEEYVYPKFGPGQLWEAVADDIVKMGGTIVKNSEVKYLNTENGKIKNVVCLENGQEKVYEGDIFMSSMPVKV